MQNYLQKRTGLPVKVEIISNAESLQNRQHAVLTPSLPRREWGGNWKVEWVREKRKERKIREWKGNGREGDGS